MSVEQLVREKDKLKRELSDIEGWRAKIRLGSTLRTRDVETRLFFRSRTRESVVPTDIAYEFYDFLADLSGRKQERIAAIETQLKTASVLMSES